MLSNLKFLLLLSLFIVISGLGSTKSWSEEESPKISKVNLAKSNDPLPTSTRTFKTYNDAEGLSQSTVTAIARDQDGFVWLGTQDGLNRFDGYGFKVYKSTPENGLNSSFIKALSTFRNKLWIGTNQGLHLFNLITEDIRFFDLSESDVEDIDTLHVDKFNRLWIGQNNRLLKTDLTSLPHLDAKTAQQKQKVAEELNQFNFVVDKVTTFNEDEEILEISSSNQRVWVLTNLALYSYFDGKIRPFKLEFNQFAKNPLLDEVKGIHVDDNILYIGTESSGAFALDLRDYKLEHLGIEYIQHITRFTRTTSDELWVGGDSGIAVYNLIEKTSEHIIADPYRTGALPSNIIETLMHIDNTVYVGTQGSGLSTSSSAKQLFTTLNDDPRTSTLLSNKAIRGIKSDKRGNIWIGTDMGLNYYDPEKKKVTHYTKHKSGRYNITGERFNAIHIDNEENIWVASRQNGLLKIMPNGDQTLFKPEKNVSNKLQGSLFICIVPHPTNINLLYLCSRGVGIEIFNKATNTSKLVSTNSGGLFDLGSNSIQTMFFDKQQRLWIGTLDAGAAVIDFKANESKRFTFNQNVESPIPSNIVLDFYQTDSETMWLATWDGLVKMDLNDLSTKIYQTKDGLSNNSVYMILEDNKGYLWVTTNKGLSKFDPALEKFEHFYDTEGLPSNEFNSAAFTKDLNGNFWAGTINGLVRFKPSTLTELSSAPNVVLTNFTLFNQDASPKELDSSVANAIHHSDGLTLNHQQQVFGIEFSALTAKRPEKIVYQYRLVGFNDQWLTTRADQRKATFTNLDPGNYLFEVRAHSGDFQWNEPTQLALNVKAAPWFSIPALSAYFVSIFGFMYWFIRDRRIKQAEKELAQERIKVSEQQLANALWGSGDELWDWDLQSHMLSFKNSSNMLHSSSGSFVGLEQIRHLIHPEDYGSVTKALEDHLNGKTEFYDVTYRTIGQDKKWHWIIDKGRIVERDGDGRPKRLSGTKKIIDHIKEIEVQLRDLNQDLEQRVESRTEALQDANDELQASFRNLQQAQTQLVEAEKMASLGSMVAGVAHEINTPLGICATSISFLKDEVDKLYELESSGKLKRDDFINAKSTMTDSIDILTRNINRSAKLIESFKKVAVDQSFEQIQTFSLDELLQNCIVSTQPEWTRQSHQISVEGNSHISLFGYPGILSQVFINLITNSVKHGFVDNHASKQKIVFEISQPDEDHIQVIYSDTGRGIPEKAQRSIFEPFFTTNRAGGGSGLGMHIAFNIIFQKWQGSIELEGDQKSGAKFKIILPVKLTEIEGENDSGSDAIKQA